MNTSSLAIIIAALLISAAVLFASSAQRPPLGSALPGTPATIASSSAPVLAANAARVIMATTTGCTARSITTQSTAIQLTFNDRDTPTLGTGAWQGASTTVTYDGGQYGCGAFKAISAAAQVVTVYDAR